MPLIKILPIALEPDLEADDTLGTGPIAIEGDTVRTCLENLYPGFTEFTEVAAIVTVDSIVYLRKDWDLRISPDATLAIRFLPGAPAAAGAAAIYAYYAAMVIMVVAMVATMILVGKPKGLDSLPEPDPIYTLTGQQNRIKPMSPIDTPYGRNRIFPAYVSRSYIRYIDNKQYLYQLFCIGQGDYDIEGLYIEDTAIGSYSDIEYAITDSYLYASIVDYRVISCEEVNGIELFGPNEVDFQVAGPFIAVPAGETVDYIEIDVAYPNGLYDTSSKGSLETTWARSLFEYQEIDDGGYPKGPWQTLAVVEDCLEETTPQFQTRFANVPAGRYQLRARRTNKASDKMNCQDRIVWAGARTRLTYPRSLNGDPGPHAPVPIRLMTFVELKMRASNQLNDSVKARFNVVCTRRPSPIVCEVLPQLSVYKGTRSIVAAFVDVLTSDYGAGLTDTDPVTEQFLHFDVDTLRRLHEEWEAEGRYFDHVFSQKTTVWEALKAIARAGRAIPVIHGSTITMVRDRPKTLPTAIFNADNIVAGSLKWEAKAISHREPDGVEVAYVDPMTGLQKTVVATLPGVETPANPEKITLNGCTSETWAYREGLYILSTNKYVRQNIRFRTGLEGMIPFTAT